MKHFVICVTISHNNRFNFKHVSQNFFTYCRVNPYFPEKLNDVATIQSFVQIFQFSINSTKNVLIDKMAVLCVFVKKKILFIVFFLSVNLLKSDCVLCFSCDKDCEPLSAQTDIVDWRGKQVAAIMEYLTTFHSFSVS